MWKWLTAAALVYGLIAAAFVCSPRSTALTRLMDIVAVSEAWQRHGAVPPVHTFEHPLPPPHTHPETPTDVIELDDGRRVLRWLPDGAAGTNILLLPVAPPGPGASGLALEIRGKGTGFIVVGVRETDGSLYGELHPIGEDWRGIVAPLDMLHPVMRSADENSHLDPYQVASVFIAVLSAQAFKDARRDLDTEFQRRIRKWLEQQATGGQVELEIDDFGVIPHTGPPEGERPYERRPPPEGQQRSRPGPGRSRWN